jgi:hypothetical protein
MPQCIIDGVQWQNAELCNLTQQLSARAHALRTAATDEQFGLNQSQLSASIVQSRNRRNLGIGATPRAEWDQFVATAAAAFNTFITQATSPSGVLTHPEQIQFPALLVSEAPFYKQTWFLGIAGAVAIGAIVMVYLKSQEEEEFLMPVSRGRPRKLARGRTAQERLMREKFPGMF